MFFMVSEWMYIDLPTSVSFLLPYLIIFTLVLILSSTPPRAHTVFKNIIAAVVFSGFCLRFGPVSEWVSEWVLINGSFVEEALLAKLKKPLRGFFCWAHSSKRKKEREKN